jgi:hypothetical protein
MDGSPSSVIMTGFGNGTFAGSAGLVLTLGFGIAALGATGVIFSSRIDCHGNADRANCHGNQERIDCEGSQGRIEVHGAKA